MVLRIAGPVLAQAIRFVRGWVLDVGARRLALGVVDVDIFDGDLEASVRLAARSRRRHLMIRSHRVQPDGSPPEPDLPVDDVAAVIPLQPARCAAEGPDQEVMSRLDVLVDQDRDNGNPWSVLLRGHQSTVWTRPARRLGKT